MCACTTKYTPIVLDNNNNNITMHSMLNDNGFQTFEQEGFMFTEHTCYVFNCGPLFVHCLFKCSKYCCTHVKHSACFMWLYGMMQQHVILVARLIKKEKLS